MKRLTEELPSSGERTCNHTWKKVKEEREDGKDYLVCERCGATKLVKKPVFQESTDGKPLLLG